MTHRPRKYPSSTCAERDARVTFTSDEPREIGEASLPVSLVRVPRPTRQRGEPCVSLLRQPPFSVAGSLHRHPLAQPVALFDMAEPDAGVTFASDEVL